MSSSSRSSSPASRISVDSAALLVSVGLFFFTARWFTNQERQRRALGLWGANTKNAATASNSGGGNVKGTPAEGIIGSRGLLALEAPRGPYLEDFMYCLHVSDFAI